MKNLKFQGIFRSEDQLPFAGLPKGACPLREPDSFAKINLVAMGICLPLIILIVAAVAVSHAMCGALPFKYPLQLWVGYLLALVSVLPHELLHAAALPKSAEVGLWIAPKHLAAFVTTTVPMSKGRFLFVSAVPSLVLGWIPLAIWFFLASSPTSAILFSFGALGTLFGAGDLMNIFNVATQVPRGATVQNSGFHTYWYEGGEQSSSATTA